MRFHLCLSIPHSLSLVVQLLQYYYPQSSTLQPWQPFDSAASEGKKERRCEIEGEQRITRKHACYFDPSCLLDLAVSLAHCREVRVSPDWSSSWKRVKRVGHEMWGNERENRNSLLLSVKHNEQTTVLMNQRITSPRAWLKTTSRTLQAWWRAGVERFICFLHRPS